MLQPPRTEDVPDAEELNEEGSRGLRGVLSFGELFSGLGAERVEIVGPAAGDDAAGLRNEKSGG